MVRNSQRYKNTLSLTFQQKNQLCKRVCFDFILLKFCKATKMPHCKKNYFRKKNIHKSNYYVQSFCMKNFVCMAHTMRKKIKSHSLLRHVLNHISLRIRHGYKAFNSINAVTGPHKHVDARAHITLFILE